MMAAGPAIGCTRHVSIVPLAHAGRKQGSGVIIGVTDLACLCTDALGHQQILWVPQRPQGSLEVGPRAHSMRANSAPICQNDVVETPQG